MDVRRPAGGALLALALLAGCSPAGSTGSAGGSATASGTPSQEPGTASPVPETDAAGATSPAPQAPPEAPPSPTAAVATTTVSGLTMFSSPTGNILCGLAEGDAGQWARCDIREKEWTPPPQPDDCAFDWGSSLEVGAQGAQFACVSDAVGDPGRPLGYGQALRAGELVCRSEQSGITCEHLATGHGFTLSRDDVSLS